MFVTGKTCVACVELAAAATSEEASSGDQTDPCRCMPHARLVRSHVFFPRVRGSPLGIATLDSNTQITYVVQCPTKWPL